ncbi:unnamed protein product, partial [Durusdinium trenchii]
DFSFMGCIGTGVTDSSLKPFNCPKSSCSIDPRLVDDNRCDCPDCADETNWTCATCSCPTICGVSLYQCDGTGTFACPKKDPQDEVCNLPGSLRNDGICHCPGTCADEEGLLPFLFWPFDCDVCRCPQACGQDIFASLYRCIGEFVFTQLDPPFACDDGCVIPGTFVDDGKCDCPGTCKDERDFTCDNCSCPEFCNQVLAPCKQIYFQCPGSACTIDIYAFNDNRCDCPGTCADEEAWTCESCEQYGYGCPAEQSCGIGNDCDRRIRFCPDHPNCEIAGYQVNNNICDCPRCEDEAHWNCDTCTGGCPKTCGASAGTFCPVHALRETTQLQCPGKACAITAAQLFDDRCDCPGTCADEYNSQCQCSFGVCPAECGDIVPSCSTLAVASFSSDWTQRRRRMTRAGNETHLMMGRGGIIAAIMDFTLAIQQAMRETFKSIDWMAGEEESEAVKTELKDDCHALRKAFGRQYGPLLPFFRDALEKSLLARAPGAMRAMGGDVSGPSFTEGLSILIIQEAVEILFSPKDMEVIRLDLEQRFQTEGCARAAAVEAASKAEDHVSALLARATRDKTDSNAAFYAARSKFRHVAPVDFILEEIIRVSYVKFPTVHPFVDSKQGRRMQASDLMSQLAPDAFTCPGEAGEGCVLPRSFVNDRKCDCPGTCADEDKEVGMALGLGLGTALGLALGLGLGLTVAAGAFLAVGLLEMLVPDPQEKGIW